MIGQLAPWIVGLIAVALAWRAAKAIAGIVVLALLAYEAWSHGLIPSAIP
jgi:hypothetical protein